MVQLGVFLEPVYVCSFLDYLVDSIQLAHPPWDYLVVTALLE